MIRTLILMPLLFLAAEEEVERIDVAAVSPDLRAGLVTHVKEHGLAPVDYLVEKVKSHDVVFLGENHWIQESCALVSESLGPLYRKAGLRALATEFARSRHAKRLNEIVTAETYDEAAVIEIFRDGPWPIWGFRDYEDIFESAWKLNRSLPEGAEPLRIIPLDSEWSQYALWFELDRREGFEMNLARERHMTRVLDEQAFQAKRRTLVHCGSGHALTCQGERLGTVLFRKYPDRVFHVQLHVNVPSGRTRSALTTMLEGVFAEAGGKPVGLDIGGSPFDDLYDPHAVWWRFLPDARFSGLAPGYLFLAPMGGLHRVSWIEGFVTDETFEKALAVCEKFGWIVRGECESPAELNAALAKRFAGGLVEEKPD